MQLNLSKLTLSHSDFFKVLRDCKWSCCEGPLLYLTLFALRVLTQARKLSRKRIVFKVMQFYFESGNITNTCLIQTPCYFGWRFWSLAYTLFVAGDTLNRMSSHSAVFYLKSTNLIGFFIVHRFLFADRRTETENFSYF